MDMQKTNIARNIVVMHLKYSLCTLLLTMTVLGCINKIKDTDSSPQITEINFGELKKVKNSILNIDQIIRLKLSDSTVLGTINQVEVFNDKIYLLDDNYLYEFSFDGKFLRKLNRKGNGPGEFIMLHSFFIDHENGNLYLYDPIGGRLLSYGIQQFNFIQNIELPYLSPFSFIKDSKSDLFIYYYSIRPYDDLHTHLVMSNKEGIVKSHLLNGEKSGHLMHGDPRNIYSINGIVRLYPNFSNKIYELNNDSLFTRYSLDFGPHSFPSAEFFMSFDDERPLMKELIVGDSNWIRLMYVYETQKYLTVKYYINREFYVAYWDKESNKKLHFKASDLDDDLRIGGNFPLPIGTYNDKIIGLLNPYTMDINQIEKPDLLYLKKSDLESQNPILLLYKIELMTNN